MSGPATLVLRSARALYGVIGSSAHGAAAAARGIPGLSEPRRAELEERIGRYASPTGWTTRHPSVWVHAASVGEVRAVEPLVAALRSRFVEAGFTFTCQTETGRVLALSVGAEVAHIAPIDSRLAVSRAIERFRPDLFLLVEAEIWPQLLSALAAERIPAAMVNARVSQRSFARYSRISLVRSLFSDALSTLARVCARDEESARRLVSLGARPETTTVCGDLKLAALDDAIVAGTPPALPMRVGGPLYVLAISTHEGEDAIVLDAFARVRAAKPGLRLVLAPRHPERCDAVLALAAKHGPALAWSTTGTGNRDWSVLVVDTIGAIPGFLRSASCGFVGGSLVPVGGHNLAEPAAFRVPVAAGPHLDNVAHQASLLKQEAALAIVRDVAELAAVWQRWLDHPDAAKRFANAAHDALAGGASALDRTLTEIEPLLERFASTRETVA